MNVVLDNVRAFDNTVSLEAQGSASNVTTEIVHTPFGTENIGQWVEYDDDILVYYDDETHVEYEIG